MGFFDGPKPNEIENWVCILERGTEYEVALARNYLAHLKIPSNILSKRDSSVNLTIGETSMVYLYVPKEFEKKARKALKELDEQEGLAGEEWDEPDSESGETGPGDDRETFDPTRDRTGRNQDHSDENRDRGALD